MSALAIPPPNPAEALRLGGAGFLPGTREPSVAEAACLEAQLAAGAEDAAGGLRPLIDFLGRLLDARAMAWLADPALADAPPDCAAAAKPGAAGRLVALRPTFPRDRALALPAPEAGPGVFTLSTPVMREGRLRGWLAAQVLVPNARDLPAFLVLLQTAAGYLLYREQRRATARLAEVLERASGLLELFRRAGAELDFDKACALAVEALGEEFHCSRVTLGWRRGGAIRLGAISGVARLDPKSPAHQPWEAAMREALPFGDRVEWTPATAPSAATAAHELLGRTTGAARLVTLPLPRGGGALVLEWTVEDAEGPALAAAAGGFVPVLFDLLERARPHPALFTMGRWWRALSSNKRRLAVGAAVAFAALLACPFPCSVRAGCRLVPVTKQVIAAPFDGQLRRSLVRPGDRVEAGDALGELDQRELRMKESELLASRERARKRRDRAMTNQGEGADFAAAQIASFEAQSVEGELALVQRKLTLLQVTAPIAGIVVSGDLRRSEGQPVQQGQVLWEVAPLDEMIVEVEVPDREISRVRAGQRVSVRLESFSGAQWKGVVERIHPQSEPREGRNVFLCEVPLRDIERAGELRPGMRGRAAVESDARPLVWILGHRLWEWLVTTLLW